MATIIDGKQTAEVVLAECAEEIQALKESGVTPGLAVVLVGEDPASQVYVNSKVRKCTELGIHSEKIVLSKEATQEEVLETVLPARMPIPLPVPFLRMDGDYLLLIMRKQR